MQDSPSPGASVPNASFSLKAPRLRWVILFVCVAALVFWYMHRNDLRAWWLEDLIVYTHALHNWQAGQNPYNADYSPLFFVYPPIFLYMAQLAWYLLPQHWGAYVYAVVHVTAICALPLVLARFYFRQTWLTPLFALVVFFASPRFTGMLALSGMNIASTVYLLAFVAAIPGLRRNRWEWLYLVVFLAAIVKVIFLVLLLLPLLVGRRQWVRSIFCGVAVVGTNLLEKAMLPQLYSGYRWSLVQGILMQQAYGYGSFAMFSVAEFKLNLAIQWLPYFFSALLSLSLVSLMLILRRRLEKQTELTTNGIWLALVVATMILANPREMQYDVDISLMAGFVLWVYVLRTKRLLILITLMFLPTFLVPLWIQNGHWQGMYETCLVMAAFCTGYWKLWHESQEAGFGIRTGPEMVMARAKLQQAG